MALYQVQEENEQKVLVPLTDTTPVDEVTANNMQSVTSNAVYNAMFPSSTTIIESGTKRTVNVTAGRADWWGSGLSIPAVPSGKRLVKVFAKCSSNQVACLVGTYANNLPCIITVSDVSASVSIWYCIEVADI